MRRARHLLWVLALAAAPAANATSVTVQISGTWDSVTDNASVTNGSITVGGAFLATLVYDDATPDIDPDPNVGGYLLPAGSTDLVLGTGAYAFTLPAAEGIVFGIDNNVSGQDDFGFFAENFTSSGPFPVGVSTGYGYANPFLFDTTELALSSDDLTSLPWNAALYDGRNFYFLIQVLGAGSNKFIELSGTIAELNVLPEPSTLALVSLASAALAFTRRRG